MINGNPSKRPTAKEILSSDYLPPRVEHEQINDLLRSMENNTEIYDQIIDTIFRKSNNKKE